MTHGLDNVFAHRAFRYPQPRSDLRVSHAFEAIEQQRQPRIAWQEMQRLVEQFQSAYYRQQPAPPPVAQPAPPPVAQNETRR